ncbi:tetratricopeptide repeat protein [Thermodesulfobacteriota bacterium]
MRACAKSSFSRYMLEVLMVISTGGMEPDRCCPLDTSERRLTLPPEVRSLIEEAEEAFAARYFSKARRLYSRADRKAPGNSSILLGRAMSHEMLGSLSEAVVNCREAVAVDKDNYFAMESLAGIYERTGEDLPGAIRLFRRALELDPRSAWRENLEVWIAALESRLNATKTSMVRLWHLGNEHIQTGSPAKAEACYTQAI